MDPVESETIYKHKTARQSIDSIQWSRGLAAIGVFLFHLDISTTEKFGHTWWSGWFLGGSTGVEFFFIISGFIILHTHRTDVGQPRQLTSFISKRFIRLYPIYWFVAVPLGLVLLLGASSHVSRTLTGSDVILDLLLIPREGARTLQPAWTLQHELVFYLIFSALICNAAVGLLVFASWQCACLATLVFDLIPVGYQNMQPLARFFGHENFGFLIGMLIALAYRRYGRDHAALFRNTGVLGAAGLVLAFALRGCSGRAIFPNAAAEALLFFVLYAMLMLGLLIVRGTRFPILGKALGVLGSASYVLYLVHEPIISIAVKIAQSPILAGRVTGSTVAITAFVAGVSVAIGVHRLVEQPLLAFLRNAAFGHPPVSKMAGQAL